MKFKSGFIGIVGRPNVGKSTLLNAILGEKIAIISDKPQTTRNSIRGVHSGDDFQMIFIDTPGIHKPKSKLGNYMTDTAVGTLNEVDIIVFIVDDKLDAGPGDRYILELLSNIKTPKILIINKIDKISPDDFKVIYEEYEETKVFNKIVGISAIEGKNVETLIETIKEMLPEGPMFFPKDMVADHPERFIVSEIIREKVLHYLDDEVPHGVAVEIENMKEEKNITRIEAVIYCEKKSHKGIIIGKEGKKLKGIGKSARIEIEGLLGVKVYLEIWVKIRENWRDNESVLNSLGYRR